MRAIEERMKELRPAVDEYARLADAYGKIYRSQDVQAVPNAGQNGTGRRGRPVGTGIRPAQVARIVQQEPGLTVAQIADRVGIRPGYLYRVLPQLTDEGAVIKRGRGWFPLTASS